MGFVDSSACLARIALPSATRQPPAGAGHQNRKLVRHRHFASRGRVFMRGAVFASHCPRWADSAKLAHVCWTGSSGGHHPSPDDRPTSYSTRRQISLGGLLYGRQFHCRPSLRRPGLFMPRVSRVLGTRSPPLASYLAQCAQRRTQGLAVPRSGFASDRCSRHWAGRGCGHGS